MLDFCESYASRCACPKFFETQCSVGEHGTASPADLWASCDIVILTYLVVKLLWLLHDGTTAIYNLLDVYRRWY